jgi:uncharacterized protein YjbI with pentapeptide repeats
LSLYAVLPYTVLCDTHKREAMANAEQLALLKAGVEGWNKWRKEDNWKTPVELSEADLGKANLFGAYLREANLRNAHLMEADLTRADLSKAKLIEANLSEANLSRADLSGADLTQAKLNKADLSPAILKEANLTRASLNGVKLMGTIFRRANLSQANLFRVRFTMTDLSEANLSEANLIEADFTEVNLRGANLSGAQLHRANLNSADLRGANLSRAKLISASLVGAKINNAKISESFVYGVNVWDIEGEFKEQKDLIITPGQGSAITVDNIEIAQFIYLILNNKKIRDVINTLTSKTVLILGRFAISERKQILDALRNKLREYDLLPIVFDFDRPTDKDFTETIRTLAGMCYFVIADVTNPKSSPLELQATVPDYQIPFVPIIQEGEYPFAMMVDLQKKYNWVLDTISYDSLETLLEILKPHIIDPAIEMRNKLRQIKAQEPIIISGRELRDKGKS